MKQFIFIILLSCLLLMCSCSNNNYIDSNAPEQSNENLNNEQIGDTVKPNGGERPLLTLESFEDYSKVINTQKIPENFVQYEKIDELGAFKCLVFLSDAYSDDYSSYMYTLIDSTGYRLALYVDHDIAEKDYGSINPVTSINLNDMRTLNDEKSGIFVTNGITYRYVSGKLLSVSWIDDGISFDLCCSSMFSDYPIEKSTFVQKMLNANEVTNALNEMSVH